MDRTERLAMIERLQRENAEARERIAELERRRADNPCGFGDVVIADRRATEDDTDLAFGATVGPTGQEPMGAPPVRQNKMPGIIYRNYDPSAQASAAAETSGVLFGDDRDQALACALGS